MASDSIATAARTQSARAWHCGAAISTALFRQLPYDVLRDFTPITITVWFDLIIATKAGGPLQSVADILKAARESPGKLNFGTIAPGSTQNLSAELPNGAP